MEPFTLGRAVVRWHDQDGLPLYLSLEMAAESGRPVALLGMLCEAASRGIAARTALDWCREWARWFVPTAAERRAIEAMESKCGD